MAAAEFNGLKQGLVSEEVKRQVCREIVVALFKHGPDFRFVAILERFPGVSRSSFYMWVRKIKGQHAAGALPDDLVKGAKQEVAKRNRKQRAAAGEDRKKEIVAGAGDALPAAIDYLVELKKSIKAANDVDEFARGPDGKVRSSKLVLLAARERNHALAVLAKIQSDMMDAERLRQFHQALFALITEYLRGHDPKIAAGLATEIQALTRRWGLMA